MNNMIDYTERTYRVLRSYNKDKSYYTTRVSIPREMLEDLGVNEEADRICFRRVENGILIKKA